MKYKAKVVCWNCRRSTVQLFNIKNEDKKTADYVCVECRLDFPTPPTPNMSLEYFKEDEPGVVTVEGDKVT